MKKLFFLIFVLIQFHGCAIISFFAQFRCPVSYADSRYEGTGRDITRYTVPSLNKSPLGIPIGPGIEGAKIDKAFIEVSECLGMKFNSCGVHAVFIAPNYITMMDEEGTQVFPCKDPISGLCTGVNQYPATIILTPDMKSLKWEVERMLLKDDPNKDGGKNCWQK